jgi:hypothetical protein
MVKIRYTDLPAGLHVSAEKHGRHTVIYLLPGLTAAQRRAALIRVRSSARMGHGPQLPAVRMAVAVGLDRLRSIVCNGAGAMRAQPLLLLPPLILLVSGGIVFMLMSFVTLTVRSHDPAQGATRPPGRVAPTPPRHSRPSPDPSTVQPAVVGPRGSQPGTYRPGKARPTPSVSSPSSTPPIISDSPTPSPTPSTLSPSPSPTPSPSASQSQSCLKLGPLGLCVGL